MSITVSCHLRGLKIQYVLDISLDSPLTVLEALCRWKSQNYPAKVEPVKRLMECFFQMFTKAMPGLDCGHLPPLPSIVFFYRIRKYFLRFLEKLLEKPVSQFFVDCIRGVSPTIGARRGRVYLQNKSNSRANTVLLTVISMCDCRSTCAITYSGYDEKRYSLADSSGYTGHVPIHPFLYRSQRKVSQRFLPCFGRVLFIDGKVSCQSWQL